jgi:hypothetical protein
MPVYTFQDQNGVQVSRRLSFEEFDSVKSGAKQILDDENRPLKLVLTASFRTVLKDGVSGGWMSKAGKENKYRAQHRNVLAKRERDHVEKPRLVPNLAGAEAATWADAREQVRATKGNEAASTYDALVAKEATS